MTTTSSRSSASVGQWADRSHDWIRSRMAPLERVAELVPPGALVLELGCGQGLLMQALAPRAQRVIGVDFDARKCRMARERLRDYANVDIIEADVDEYLGQAASGALDAVVLSDTLSSLPYSTQERVLSEGVRCLRPGGLLLLKIVDTAPHWKARLAQALSFVIYRLIRASLTLEARFYYLHHAHYVDMLEALGTQVSVISLHQEPASVIPHVAILGWKETGLS